MLGWRGHVGHRQATLAQGGPELGHYLPIALQSLLAPWQDTGIPSLSHSQTPPYSSSASGTKLPELMGWMGQALLAPVVTTEMEGSSAWESDPGYKAFVGQGHIHMKGGVLWALTGEGH